MSDRSRGVTLVELLVAVSLMVILTGSLSYVFTTARNIFSRSEATIQVYQNARNAFDIIERELSMAVRTHDIDFFNETSETENGHYDDGETFGGINVDDPTKDDKQSYTYGMTIYGRKYSDLKNPSRREHRCDMIYFKTLTLVKGKTRSALVLYRLDLQDTSKPILKKYVLYRGGDPLNPAYEKDPADGSGQDLCMYLTDFRVEYYFDNVLDNRPPGFYEVPINKEKVFCYLGTGNQGRTNADGIFSTTGFDDPYSDNFSQLAAKDRIFLYGGSAPWERGDNTDYIIDTIARDGKLTFTRFGPGVPTGVGGISFRAGYLPSGLRFTLKIIDSDGQQVRTLTRIVKIHSH